MNDQDIIDQGMNTMSFDPMADIIDLRDAIEEWEDNEEARAFFGAMAKDLGYDGGIYDWAFELSENEPTVNRTSLLRGVCPGACWGVGRDAYRVLVAALLH